MAQVEAELQELEEEEALEYLQSLGVEEGGLRSLIAATYKQLGLLTYFTTGRSNSAAPYWQYCSYVHLSVKSQQPTNSLSSNWSTSCVYAYRKFGCELHGRWMHTIQCVAIQVSKRPVLGPSRMASQRLRQQESFTQTLSGASSGLKQCHTMHTQRQAVLGLHERRVSCAWKERSMWSKKETSCYLDSMCSLRILFLASCKCTVLISGATVQFRGILVLVIVILCMLKHTLLPSCSSVVGRTCICRPSAAEYLMQLVISAYD